MLASVDDVAIAPPFGASGHVAGGAPRSRLGDADGGLVSREDEGSAQALLLLGPVVHESRDRSHVRLDHDPTGDAAHAGHLLDDERDIEKAPPLATVAFRDRHAHEPGGAERLDVVPRILLGAVDLGGMRFDALASERPGPLPQRLLLGGQIKLGRVVQRMIPT